MLLTVLLILCGLIILILFLLMPGESNAKQRAPFFGRNVAHRGLHSQDKSIPENSLAAFSAAVENGFGIELDLQLTKDEKVVVFHDDNLKRVCGVDALLADFTYEELCAFRLHDTDQQIPLFTEVLKIVDGKVPMIVELKSSGKRNKRLCQCSWEILRNYKGDICLESFDPRLVRCFKKYIPGVLRGQLSATPPELIEDFGDTFIGHIVCFVVGNGLANFMGRPQFIAYQKGKRPWLIRFAERFCMRVVYTVRPDDDIQAIEDEHDTVIFEFYHPQTHYAELPPELANAPTEEDWL